MNTLKAVDSVELPPALPSQTASNDNAVFADEIPLSSRALLALRRGAPHSVQEVRQLLNAFLEIQSHTGDGQLARQSVTDVHRALLRASLSACVHRSNAANRLRSCGNFTSALTLTCTARR